jgi:acetyl esterase/lipase
MANAVEPEPAAQRAALTRLAAAFVPEDDVHIEAVVIGNRAAEWVWTDGALPDQVVVHFHGGGFCVGEPAMCRQFASRLSRATRVRVLLPSYRLAPEHTFPAPVEDAVDVYRSLLDAGHRPAQIILGGDSAGGNLAFSALLLVRERHYPLPGGAYGLSPFVDLSLSSAAANDPDSRDPVTSPVRMKAQRDRYLAGADASSPLASPMLGELRGLPPIHIEVGSSERLVDDARRMIEQALIAGVQASLTEVEEAIHCFQTLAPETPEAEESIRRLAAHVRAWIAHSEPPVTPSMTSDPA